MTSRRGLATGIASVAGLALSLLALPVTPASAAPAQPSADPQATAIAAADRVAAAGAVGLRKSSSESLHRVSTTLGDAGLYYNSYERTYDGLRVVGGDAVIVADGTGRVRGTDSAEGAAITVGTTPTVDAARAASVARGQLPTVSKVSKPDLVVLGGAQPKLAYEVVVAGRTAKAPSNLHVFVDAATGKVLDQRDDVKAESPAKTGTTAAAPAVAGTGNSYYVGQVSIDTTGSGSSYSMRDPNRSGISCGRENGSVFTKSSNTWGNGSGTDLETGCVDTLYSVQTEWNMLKDWLGRNGIDGNGRGFPASVGLNDVNAYWDGSSTHFGHSQDNQRQATSMDVVGHEFGHGIFQNTPGGAGSGNENGGLNESTGDIFGALTEFYANNAKDKPDFEVGEGVNLVGRGPIRYMYDPNRIGDPNCYSSSIPNTEVHAAAGPQNHWFYLLAEGTSPSDGQPTSPTCNNSSVTGIGIQKAGKIFYNGLLHKTSSWNHKAARKATLQAAVDLFPGSCVEYKATKAAWDGVSVGAVSGEATCNSEPPKDNDFSVELSPTTATVEPGASAKSTVTTKITNGNAQQVKLTASGLPSGATATFSPDTIQSGATATVTIATTASTPKGTSKVTITATGANATHTSDFTLVVGSGTPPGCGGIAAWDSNTFYGPGDVVSHNNHKWTSTWYSVGAEPGAPGSWAVWTDNGAC
ncbi:M4 family metallopeptidase [Amycolatopsis sp. WGS_07]|uniref:M4 family metallopeptidase n=1 Tax=Amycolatopsis sp. WGS_07 TaxID=3076764 RepID=UPI0038737FBD